MSSLLPCVEVEPHDRPATGSVVWLHGLGADGHDFEPVVPVLETPHLRFIFPHAPAIPVTINMGMVMPAWYDILTLGGDGPRHHDAQIRASATRIEALIARERSRGIPSERIVLGGFSQGGAMALHVGTRYPESLAGIMVLSAYHLLPDTFDSERAPANTHTPVFFAHGTNDDVVPLAAGRAAHRALTTAGQPAVWHEYPMAHQVSIDELRDIGTWLRECVPLT